MLSLNWNVLMKLNVTRRYADEQGRVMPLMCMVLQPGFFVYADEILLDIMKESIVYPEFLLFLKEVNANKKYCTEGVKKCTL